MLSASSSLCSISIPFWFVDYSDNEWSISIVPVSSLLVLSGSQSSGSVGESDVELGGALDDGLPLLGGDVVRDLSAVLSIVHEQELKILQVADGELEEPVWKNVPGLLVGSVTDVWLRSDSSELSPLPSVDTSRVTPALLDGDLPVALVSLELASKFLFMGKGRRERERESQRRRRRRRRFGIPSSRAARSALYSRATPLGTNGEGEGATRTREPLGSRPRSSPHSLRPSTSRARARCLAPPCLREALTLTILAFTIGCTMVAVFLSLARSLLKKNYARPSPAPPFCFPPLGPAAGGGKRRVENPSCGCLDLDCGSSNVNKQVSEI